jgi:hypothetical protein
MFLLASGAAKNEPYASLVPDCWVNTAAVIRSQGLRRRIREVTSLLSRRFWKKSVLETKGIYFSGSKGDYF